MSMTLMAFLRKADIPTNEQIQETIYQAIFASKQISAQYKPINSAHSKEYILHPLGLISRGVVTYLVASAFSYHEVKLYVLHRFESVEILNRQSLPLQPNFNNKVQNYFKAND